MAHPTAARRWAPDPRSRETPTLTERLFGANGPERLERYTRLSSFSMFLMLPFVALAVGSFLLRSDRPEAVWFALAWGLGILAACLMGAFTYAAALRGYLEGTPMRRRDWLPLAMLCAALALLPFTFPVPAVDDFGSPGLASLAAMLPAACALAPALPPSWTWRVVLGVVAVAVAADLVAVGDPARLAMVAVIALFWSAIFVPTMRLSAWMIGVVRELDRARATSARLAVAEERLRFSRDLHDVVGRSLSTISLKTELATALLQRDRTEQAAAELAAVRDLAADSLTEMRAVVAGYRRADLTAELTGARAVLDSAGVRTQLLGPLGRVESLDEGVQEALAWVVREGTTNVVRHSSATHCTLAFELGDRDVLLTLTNDGAGDAPAARDAVTHHHGAGGNGLLGLAERLAALGGSLRHGVEGDTYVLAARVPLAASVTSVPVDPAPVESVPVGSLPVDPVPRDPAGTAQRPTEPQPTTRNEAL